MYILPVLLYLIFVVDEAIIHDDDKRKQKEALKTAMAGVDPALRPQITASLHRELERDKNGFRRVTGLDWRDFGEWGILERILRYADSNCATAMFTPEQASGPYSEQGLVQKETIADWRERLDRLAKRDSLIGQIVGNEFYGGKPAFEQLAEITGVIETELHQEILRRHPELAQEYVESSSLNDILRAKLCERIMNTPLRSDNQAGK